MKRLIILFVLFASYLFGSVSSSALYIDKNENYIYSANLDAGSISQIELKTGNLKHEIKLGTEIRRLACNIDESIFLATDYFENKIYVLKNNQLYKTIKTPKKPHAVIYDKNKKVFYATAYEDNKVFVIDEKDLEIVQELKVEQGPRGLALSDDGRLFITHALTGKVSIYQTIEDKKPLHETASKIIQLHSTQNKDEKVSQGVPVYLDDIEISPNGKEAWLPHLLWNLDHEFQFQSTVFPTISVLDITPYNEQELKIKRKHLFKEINIKDNSNKTRIISNPWDLEFSPKGHRAYITLAGSEDLLVMDIKRSAKRKNKGRQHRIRKKRAGSGAKAVQIYRHLPGQNPRALALSKDGENIYVQNAMSLDMTLMNSGGEGNFARVSLEKEVFAKTVKKDPLSPKMRLGKTLFNLGNSDRYKNNPLVGDFWMSCASCHFEGFNSSNRFLIEYAKVNKYDSAVRGHRNLEGYISKDFVADYVRIAQQTQGGMGVEDGFGDVKQDPYSPNKEVREMMVAIQEYVRAPENLPHMSTWLKLDDKKKTAHKKEWLNSASCKSCHETIYKQWANSSHGTAMEHPYYAFHEDVAAKAEGEEFRTFCRGCHMPQLLLTGNTENYTLKDRMRDKDATFLVDALNKGEPVIEGGTSCFLCHRINKAENAGGNADLQVNLKDREEYFFEVTDSKSKRWLNEKLINANPEVHKKSYSNKELYNSSLYCATCHNEFVPGTGVKINDNYNEWLKSSFANKADKENFKSCIDCHMNSNIEDFNKGVQGFSTTGGKEKEKLKTHHFTGANDYLASFRSEEHRKLSVDLLRTATKIEMFKNEDNLTIRVKNVGAGHNFPGGARRQIWLEVTVKDSNGDIVFTDGHMEGNKLPKGAREFKKVLGLKDGKKVGLHFWRYEQMIKDTRIPADGYRDNSFVLPKDISYPISVRTRLLFRAFSPALTDKVNKHFDRDDIPYAQVVEVENETRNFYK